MIQRLVKASETQAMKITGHPPLSTKSSVHRAASRAGKRVSVLVRGVAAYVRLVGDLPQATATSRKPLTCPVCGDPIQRPLFGGSKQFVHAGKGKKKSKCQKIWRYKQAHPGMTVEEAKVRYDRRHEGNDT